jgi:alpha-glucosidase
MLKTVHRFGCVHKKAGWAARVSILAGVVATAMLTAVPPVHVRAAEAASTNETALPLIIALDPPKQGFFAKELDYHGIPIKASAAVSDQAVYEAYRRVNRLLTNFVTRQPMLISNLVAARVQVHIFGQHQVTSDLPEFRELKGKPLPEYHGLTIDQRTRGMGGRLTSCAEENLLKLKWDHYYGRDICAHEFAHAIRNFGMSLDVVDLFDQQYRASLAKGLWKGAYAASNADEFFSELTMWYFGTHGDLNMTGEKPKNGRAGLQAYDPQACRLIADFYHGRIPIAENAPGGHPWTENSSTTNAPARRAKHFK